MIGRIHSLESFGAVDGPGVRFVVFMQGCALRCKYCHNPDTWCLNGGTEYTPSAVLERMTRNITFYKTGGLTVTGGEPLLQADFVSELFALAKAQKIHTCLDTSGITFDAKNEHRVAQIDSLLNSCDLVLLDIKHSDENEHIELTGASLNNPLDFAKHLCKRKTPVWIRHVIVPGITDNEQHLTKLGSIIAELDNVEKIELLPYHTMGIPKYERLGIDYVLKDTPVADKELINKCYDIINTAISNKKNQK